MTLINNLIESSFFVYLFFFLFEIKIFFLLIKKHRSHNIFQVFKKITREKKIYIYLSKALENKKYKIKCGKFLLILKKSVIYIYICF
jgi:hypothetical protein